MARVNIFAWLIALGLTPMHFNMQGSAKEFAIIVDDTDSVSSLSEFEIEEDEPRRVKGSPLQVLPASKYG